VLKCNSAKLLFAEFPEIRLRFWGEYLWSEGYAVRTAGVVTSAKIEENFNKKIRCGYSPRKRRAVHFG
jgi:REP element-mobilizing transposase RayT